MRFFEDQTFIDSSCKVIFSSLAAKGGGAGGTTAMCEKMITDCQKSFTENAAEQKKKIEAGKLDLSKCKSKYSEISGCIEKMMSFFKTEGEKISCADPSKWSSYKEPDFEASAPECKEIMDNCPIAGPFGGGAQPPPPKPDTPKP